MDGSSAKKQRPGGNSKACQSTDASRKGTDVQSSKPWPKHSRRREQSATPRGDPQRAAKQPPAKARPYVDKRPRPRGFGGGFNGNDEASVEGAIAEGAIVNEAVAAAEMGTSSASSGTQGVAKNLRQEQQRHELNSVYAPGSKKQNLNHLLNFHYTPRDTEYRHAGLNIFGRSTGGVGGAGGASGGNVGQMHRESHGAVKKLKYNKEQFLQANFQFVIRSSAKPKLNGSPDALINWDYIEQINIQTTEEPQCPICLFPPIAAKLTRCGHAYCWPCILHYLALSDKSWRKCPICYDAVHTNDLKSTTIVQQQPVSVGQEATFYLMRRKEGSMLVERYKSLKASSVERIPRVFRDAEAKLFSKFLIAKRADIQEIIERENRELQKYADGSSEEEDVFIQRALDLLKERREKACDIVEDDEEDEEVDYEADNADAVVVDFQNMRKVLSELTLDELEIAASPCGSEQRSACERYTSESSLEEHGTLDVDVNIGLERLEEELHTEQFALVKDDMLPDAKMPTLCAIEQVDAAKKAAKYYYFYQCADGQNIFMHRMNVRMLEASFGSLEHAPHTIRACVLQKQHLSMDPIQRRKFSWLGHMPLTCQFVVVEVDLQPPVVTHDVLDMFREKIVSRKKERQRREREERKRERHINELNSRQLGQMVGPGLNVDLDSSAEFPKCGSLELFPQLQPLTAEPNAQVASESNVDVSGGTSMGAYARTARSASAAIAIPKPKPMPKAAGNLPSYSAVTLVGNSPETIDWSNFAVPSASGRRNKPQRGVNIIKAAAVNASNNESVDYHALVSANSDEVTLRTLNTNLGDVLAEAMLSQQKRHSAGGAVVASSGGGGNANMVAAASGGGKKHKRNKKMQPLFSTGMNFKNGSN